LCESGASNKRAADSKALFSFLTTVKTDRAKEKVFEVVSLIKSVGLQKIQKRHEIVAIKSEDAQGVATFRHCFGFVLFLALQRWGSAIQTRSSSPHL
jgi:hypothetical protein